MSLLAVRLLLLRERKTGQLFWPCALLALLARTDVAFVVAMFGDIWPAHEAEVDRRGAAPAVGLGYLGDCHICAGAGLYLSRRVPASPPAPITDPMACWPCGMNPHLAYYAQLGRSGPDIVGPHYHSPCRNRPA